MAPIPSGVSNPCSGVIPPVIISEIAGQHKYLLTARKTHLGKVHAGPKPLHRHLFSARRIETKSGMSFDVALFPARFRRIDHNPLPLGGRHLPQLDEDDAAGLGSRRVAASRRVANVGSSRVVAVLVGKYPFNDQEFLAKRVLMRRENAGRSIANQRGRPSNLTTDPIQQPTLDARLRRGNPR